MGNKGLALLMIVFFTGLDLFTTYLAISALYDDKWLWAIGYTILPCFVIGHSSLATAVTDVILKLAWLFYIGKCIYSFIFG